MKKKTFNSDKLSLNKEFIAKLNDEQLTNDQTELIEGGSTYGNGNSCCTGGVSCNATGAQVCRTR